MSNYLKRDGTKKLTGDLNMDNYRIKNLNDEPIRGTDGANKNYVDSTINKSHIKPSHQKDQFGYLMSNESEWTDLIDGGNSFNMTKTTDLSSSKSNFHSYNKKVIYTTIIKNAQGGYKYKMGIQCYSLLLNADYTLCTEILNTDYQLWRKAKVSIDRATSRGLTIGNVSVRKFSHDYLDSKNNKEFMYYHSLIINLKKKNASHPYFLHPLVRESTRKVGPKIT